MKKIVFGALMVALFSTTSFAGEASSVSIDSANTVTLQGPAAEKIFDTLTDQDIEADLMIIRRGESADNLTTCELQHRASREFNEETGMHDILVLVPDGIAKCVTKLK